MTFAGCSIMSAGLCCFDGSTDPSAPIDTRPDGLAVRADDDDLLLLRLLAHARDPALPGRSCTRSGILRA